MDWACARTENSRSVVTAFEGKTVTDGNSFTTKADVSVAVNDWAKLTANVTLEQVEYEEIAFAGGQAIDLTDISSEEIEKIKSEVLSAGTKISMALLMKPDVLADLMTVIGQ